MKRSIWSAIVIAIALAYIIKSDIYARSDDYIRSLNVGVSEVLNAVDMIESANKESRGSTLVAGEAAVESIEKSEVGLDYEPSEVDITGSLFMANVTNSLNVRTEPNEDASKAGLLYADCGGEVLEVKEGWVKIRSGNVEGWASDKYLLFGEEAKELATDVGIMLGVIEADALRVRKEPSKDSDVYGLVNRGDVHEVLVEDSSEDWIAIVFEGEVAYMASEFIKVDFEVDVGETIEEIEERKRVEAAEKAKLKANRGAVPVGTSDDMLLAALVQCESGGESYEGQLAVAAVVMNRVRSGAYPDSVAGVIYASGQFGPALNGKVEATLARGVKESCVTAAREAINGASNIGGATHFRRVGTREGIVIGNHVFW